MPSHNLLIKDAREPYITAERAAAHLSMSRKTLLRLARKGTLPAHGVVGLGHKRMWRFLISELDRWMQSEVTLVSDEGRFQERKTFL
jgi:excisionase family DNA binding protein